METVNVTCRLTNEERETILHYDYVNKVWTMDSTIVKHFNRALKQGWTPIQQLVYDDGSICGMVLTAPDRAVTIRSTEKKKVSDEQIRRLRGDDEED